MRKIGAFVLALVALLVCASPARATNTAEHISKYDFAATIADDGELRVTETIAYDFGQEDTTGSSATSRPAFATTTPMTASTRCTTCASPRPMRRPSSARR